MNMNDQLPDFEGQKEQVTLGRIVSVTGSQAIVMLQGQNSRSDTVRPDMGTLLRIDASRTVTLGLISGLSVPAPSVDNPTEEIWIAEIELVGELVKNDEGEAVSFRRGVSAYPRLGDSVFMAGPGDLALAYSWGSDDTIEVGTISQAPDISAVVRIDDLLGKHFAILGTTGAGKSYSTALVLRQIVTRKKQAHILLLDPHNEYANSFDGLAEIVTPSDLQLPYWLLNFEEIVEIIVGDKGDREEQIEVLGDIIPLAKKRYQVSGRSRNADLYRPGGSSTSYTVDTPTPYRLSDLLDILNELMGKLETKKTLGPYKALKMKVESLSQDPRYNFMFGAMSVQDHMNEILGRLFRIPVNGRPLTIIEMTGLPTEVVNVVVSVLARLSFDIAQWSEGTIPITLVCEEAHRYIPNDKGSGFAPTRRAIAKIAKEGRKYGVSLAIITQRPSELDPTILSQCNTVFAMRMSNEKDQNIVSAGISDAGASMLAFLPSLGTGEAIAFGDGVTLPSRLRFSQLPATALPRGSTASFSQRWESEVESDEILSAIIEKWRTIGSSPATLQNEEEEEEPVVEEAPAAPPQPPRQMYQPPQANQPPRAQPVVPQQPHPTTNAMGDSYAPQGQQADIHTQQTMLHNQYGQPQQAAHDQAAAAQHYQPQPMQQAAAQPMQQQPMQQAAAQPYVPPGQPSAAAQTGMSLRESVLAKAQDEVVEPQPAPKRGGLRGLLRK